MSELVEALRAFADPDGRIPLPMLDDKGRMVGVARRTPEEMTRVEVHVAESGTVSAPPTAWAYVAVCRALHEQKARIEALEREQGWQDIATAPKDGTAIIVTRVSPTGRNPAKIVWWANSTPCGWRWRQRRVIRFAPTHWRPLPAPPSGDEG